MKMLGVIAAAAALLLTSGIGPAGTAAQVQVQTPSLQGKPFKIVTIADWNTDIPGKQVKFSNLAGAVNDGADVAFCVTDPVTQNPTGIYLFNGRQIVTIADTDTIVPGSNEKFTDLGFPSISEGNVVFTGASASVNGIYLYNGKKIVTVVDTNTNIPGSVDKFKNPAYPSVSGGNVVLCEADPVTGNPIGIYLFNGKKVRTVADMNTTIPGSAATFDYLSYPSISGANVSFMGGSNSISGIYLFNGKKLLVAVDTNTNIPGSQIKFDGFIIYGQDQSGGNIAFIGMGGTVQGVYLYRYAERKIMKVADTNTNIPGSQSKFVNFDSPAASGGYVVFIADDANYNPTGIYLYNGKKLLAVVDTNTDIPGSHVKFSGMTSPQISGRNAAFITVDSAFNITGIYLYTPGKQPLFTVVNANTTVPDSGDKFGMLGSPAISGPRVVFTGGSVGMDGLYVYTQQ